MTDETNELDHIDILLFSTKPGPRAFVLNDKHESNFMAILSEETEDSFLVTLPAIIIENNGVRKVEAYIKDQTYLRLGKSNVKWIMFLKPEYAKMYQGYVKYCTNPDQTDQDIEDLTDKLGEVVQQAGLVFDNPGVKH